MTPNRHGSAIVEFPSDLEIVTTREFDAPLELVFDVFTKPEHVRNWFAPFDDVVTECAIDLRVGGSYHVVFVTKDMNARLKSGRGPDPGAAPGGRGAGGSSPGLRA